MSATVQLLDWVFGNDGRHEAITLERPEPVLDEAKAKTRAAAGITALITILGGLGVSTTDAGLIGVVLTVLAGAVIAIAQAVLTLRAAYAARPLVTPLADPRAADGTPLTPATPTEETDQSWALADDVAPGAESDPT